MREFGDLEMAIMQVMWAGDRPYVVREVREWMQYGRPLAYTTVMTVMGRLADAGLLIQERSGRAYRYSAAGSREELTATTMLDQLHGMGATDRRSAMLHFLGDASPDEIADLKAALAEVEARHLAGPGTKAP